MSDNITILEELVTEAVERIRDLTRERDTLREQVASLNERLDAQQHEAATEGSDEHGALMARQAQAVDRLRSALTELRGDGPTA
jgi:FtsZ-binding cell division protein ZapB